MMNENMLEPKPRWPGGPRQCTAVDLPAFETENDMKAFEEKFTANSDRKVHARWQCAACNGWHYATEIE